MLVEEPELAGRVRWRRRLVFTSSIRYGFANQLGKPI